MIEHSPKGNKIKVQIRFLCLFSVILVLIVLGTLLLQSVQENAVLTQKMDSHFLAVLVVAHVLVSINKFVQFYKTLCFSSWFYKDKF